MSHVKKVRFYLISKFGILIFIWALFLDFCLCLGVLQADNEQKESGSNVGFGPGVAFCSLPSSLGHSGSEKLLEDCESLDRFNEFPPFYSQSLWILSCYLLIFESHGCQGTEKCVTATECHFLENRDSPPPICGWYPGETNYAVCCEDENKPRSNLNVRTSAINKYDCDDYVPECSDWASKFPSSCTNVTHHSFSFMIKSCMKSCGICGNKGCVDEFDKCDYWSRKGHCVDSPEFMSINCRESCGVCGFRSIRNNEEQLVNGREYSNLEHSKFFCGRSKLKRSSDNYRILESFFYYKTEEENSNRRIICAATTISDRFIISAAHCYINFRGSTLSRINSMIIRDDTNHTEEIEMKRIFTYPSFQLPSLYNDIAVIELGRRIKFDYDTYGDSPSCLGRTEDTLVGQEAISQGYGFTEDKVTIITVVATLITKLDSNEP
ncbi:unnamed protein product [Lepeophtheirus salmonis]|uniref:(salmon louse) hypothetical protein n=1 Tax=Lepeophtheirus salmonis TaxID=72036 RepID=A0A7R8H4Q6_LEPSM|nr:unnamed protein product [Lepeophtheirus salmonis]CAF2852477.1 unnamed protein product [Lepeophtheirus salmonis]